MPGKRTMICLSALTAAGSALAAIEPDPTRLSPKQPMAVAITPVAKNSQRLSDVELHISTQLLMRAHAVQNR